MEEAGGAWLAAAALAGRPAQVHHQGLAPEQTQQVRRFLALSHTHLDRSNDNVAAAVSTQPD